MKSSMDLKNLLNAVNRKSYPAYKDTRGSYDFGSYSLHIDHVQGDPFASPSKVSISVKGKSAGFLPDLYDLPHKRIALQDLLTRKFAGEIEKYNFKAKGSGKSGLISISRCGQEVLERSACELDGQTGNILVRLEIGFPANGRTINSLELITILYEFLPRCVQSSLFYRNLKQEETAQTKKLAEDQQYIREHLKEMGLVAFIANGSVLPRETGVSQKPMKQAERFYSPDSMEVSFKLPNHGLIKGMGIRKGITLIVGGGYHGKSTILKALETGVYNHIRGDGREFVITDSTALKLRAEDSRSIFHVDISWFINNLPGGRDTRVFDTKSASGSTSQAASVMEGIEAGASLFLIDEDTSATNFMVRDELMQKVVLREQEPITPYIERVKMLSSQHGISSIIVVGSSGAFFHEADKIIQMDHYLPKDITKFAKEVSNTCPGAELTKEALPLPMPERYFRKNPAFKDHSRVKIKVLGKDSIQIEKDIIDLRYVEQLVDQEQLAALGSLLVYAEEKLLDGKRGLAEIVDILEKTLKEKGFLEICGGDYISISMAVPRRQEIFSCINRYRGLLS